MKANRLELIEQARTGNREAFDVLAAGDRKSVV